MSLPRLDRRRLMSCAAAASAAAIVLLSAPSDAGEARTRVIINGTPTPVHFNDGDSFRVLAGEYSGTKARLAGYNTLESYGPVHKWGDWTAKELYVIAKMATLNARVGSWECETDGKTDTYGRMLLWCPELAEDQVRKGLAHAMSIDDEPAKPMLVAAQKEAREKGRGIWAHGKPAFVLTSLHSVEEDVDGHGTYNRLVSSEDGHSVKWKHENRYSECTKVCHMVYRVDEAKVDEVMAALKADPAPIVAKALGGHSERELRGMVREFAEFRHIDRSVAKDLREDLEQHLLSAYAAQGAFGDDAGAEGACMYHVDFKRRFGGNKAACLK